MSPTTAVLEPSLAGPYRYLDYFHETDRATFAGREEDIAEVSARASADEPFVLYGRSGLGKTSLLLAGVFPVLRERNLNPLHIRVLSTPLVDLRNAIAGLLDMPCRLDAADLDDVVAKASKSSGLVLVFDQFEEFFISTRGQPARRREFIQRLAALSHHSRGDVRLTFSLREDYLAELDEFREVFPDILTNQYRLHPLTAFGARQAIVTPLLAVGIQFDQRLVVRLVDMLAEVDFDPVLLQIACGEVYREALKRAEDASLTEADLDRIGGIQGLFERYLDNAIAHVPEGQLLLCQAILDALTSPEETKRSVTFDTLLTNDAFQASAVEVQAVLDRLNDQKLVRRDLRGGRLFYELAHDRLAPSVVAWFKRDTDFSQFRDARDLIANATRRRALFPDKLETLIGAAQITKTIAPYRQRLRLTDDQRLMMFWSAVYSRVADTEFWARLVGEDRACQVLLFLLAHPSAEARLGAFTAAGQIATKMPGVTRACLDAALSDDDQPVRTAAARALARLAGDDEILRLNTALASRRTQSRALDVLATFIEVRGPIDRFSWIWRVRARRHAHQRAFGLHRERIVTLGLHSGMIIARGRRGALVGVTAAAGWAATIGILLACLAMWMRGEVQWMTSAFVLASISAAVLVVPAALGGWLFGRLGAARAAASGVEGRWASATFRFTLIVALGLLVLSMLLSMIDLFFLLSYGTWLLGPFMVFVVAGFYTRLFRSSIWPPDTTTPRERAGWALLLGAPLAVPLGTYGFFSDTANELVWGLAAALSAVPTIVALALSESAVAFPIGPFPTAAPRARLITRGLLVLSVLAAPSLFIQLAGVDSMPFRVKTFEVAPDFHVPLPLRAGNVDSVYFALRSPGDQPHWLEATFPQSVEVKSAFGTVWSGSSYRSDSHGQLLHVPQGYHRMSAASTSGPESQPGLRLRALPLLDEKTPLRLSEETWSPHVLRLDEVTLDDKTQPRIWRAVVRGRVMQGLQSPGGSVRFLVLAGGAPSGGELTQMLANEPMLANETWPRGPRVTYSLPRALDTVDFPLSATTPNSDHPELRPIRVEADGTFRLVLTYRPPDSKAPSDRAIGAPPGTGQPLDIPLLLAIRAPDFLERLLTTEKPESLLPRLRSNAALWNNATDLEDIAHRLSQARRHDESIELHRRVVELAPNADRFNELAWQMIVGQRGREALEPAREAARLSGRKDANIMDTLAHAEHASGNLPEAVQAWDETMKLDPSFHQPPRDNFCQEDLKHLEEARRTIAGRR